MAIKYPNYVMLKMTTYGTLDHLEGSDTQQRYKEAGGELVTKQLKYREVFRNEFNYRHQVDNNKNRQYLPISVERTWATKYWYERCHSYFLELIEVDPNYLWEYLVDRVDVEPQLDFRRQLGWEMVENTLDE